MAHVKSILIGDLPNYSNQHIEIGSAHLSDALSLLMFGQNLALEHEYQAMYPDEFKLTLDDEENFIQDYLESPDKLALVARMEGQVVGFFHVQPMSRLRKMAHIAGLGAGIAKSCRDLGLGSRMMGMVIEWIQHTTQYEKLELRVLSSNQRAIHLYQKFGFKEEARIKQAFKFSEQGPVPQYIDDVVMSLYFVRSLN